MLEAIVVEHVRLVTLQVHNVLLLQFISAEANAARLAQIKLVSCDWGNKALNLSNHHYRLVLDSRILKRAALSWGGHFNVKPGRRLSNRGPVLIWDLICIGRENAI